jgi:signal transduction histidine kinase
MSAELAEARRLLAETLEQQTATSEVLKVISRSTFDLETVLDTLLASAARLCDGHISYIFQRDGDVLRWGAGYGHTGDVLTRLRDYFKSLAVPIDRGSAVGRAAFEGAVVHLPDVLADPEYTWSEAQTIGGYRAALGAPLLREGKVAGALFVAKTVPTPFTDKQIELVKTFAAQAVIAIENTRLLNELRQRTNDLTESLEQQTATSEVLKVISSSPGELDPVFDTILAQASELCGAKYGTLWLREGGGYRTAALHGDLPSAWIEQWRSGTLYVPNDPDIPLARVTRSRAVVQVADMRTDPSYLSGQALPVSGVDIAGFRTLLIVPMLKENDLVGAISIYRTEVLPYTDKQVELMQNFAAQAVIAIENTRLLSELRESLQQQTATADVLKVISRSTFNLQSVLDTLVESATRLCEADKAAITRQSGDIFEHLTSYGYTPEHSEYMRTHPIPANRGSVSGRVVLDGKVVHIEDVRNDPEYTLADRDRFDVRTLLGVPLIREGVAIGVIIVQRSTVRPFTDKQIELVSTFADQAVIAIENARLVNELRESLQQQTATADVLKVISRSTFDLQAVLDTLVESAARLCEADTACIVRPQGDRLVFAANYRFPQEFIDLVAGSVIAAGRGTMSGRVFAERKTVHIPDVLADPEYTFSEAQRIVGFKAMLGVPLMREGTPIGILVLQRTTARPFDDKHIELVETFADQAVIAIENVRLFDEIQDKSRQLAEASQHKSQFLASMSHELRTPLNAILGYTELIADGIYGSLPDKAQGVLKRVESNGRHLLGLINAVLDLSKIEAGQLTLDLSDYSLQNVAQTVYNAVEPLALDKKLAFKAEVESDLPPGRGDERRLTQVLLNLVGNAIKFTDSGEVVIKAGASNDDFHLSVRDTGPGISAADQAKLFQEFQQADNPMTRKKEGTGLGLAISKRIVELHGGRIWMESQPGKGSTFFVTLPVQVSEQANVAN